MKYLVLIFCFLIVSSFCKGQEHPSLPFRSYPRNSIFIELGGNSVFYGSLNYDRVLLQRNFFYLSGRIGIGYGNFMSNSILSVPMLVNGIFQVYHALAFEVGLGVSFMKITKKEEYGEGLSSYEYDPGPTGAAGLRVQARNGFLFRAVFTPFITLDHIYSSGGVSFGYSFGKK